MASRVKIPAGEKITISHGKLQVPDRPIIAFIEGDGIGPDIWAASVRVLDAAVEQSYRGKKKIAWAEVYAGEQARAVSGAHGPLPLGPVDAGVVGGENEQQHVQAGEQGRGRPDLVAAADAQAGQRR